MEPDEYAERRERMVREQIRARGVRGAAVLRALESVPRERFVPERLWRLAYADRALALSHGQTISQPYMVAAMTEALAVQPGTRVLDVGTGSGYQAAVLAEIGADVYSIERLAPLVDRARHVLSQLGYDTVHLRVGDGSVGWPEHAPYSGILVAAAAPHVPRALKEQLDPEGGRLVAPVGSRDLQELVVVERRGTEWSTERLLECRFVPLVGEEGWSD